MTDTTPARTDQLTFRGRADVFLIDANSLAILTAWSLGGDISNADVCAVFGIEESPAALAALVDQVADRGKALIAAWTALPEPSRRTIPDEFQAAILADYQRQAETARRYKRADTQPSTRPPLPSRNPVHHGRAPGQVRTNAMSKGTL